MDPCAANSQPDNDNTHAESRLAAVQCCYMFSFVPLGLMLFMGEQMTKPRFTLMDICISQPS